MSEARLFAAFEARAAQNGGGARPRSVLLARDLYGFIPARCAGDWSGSALARRVCCLRSGPVAALAGPLALRWRLRGRVRGALGRLRTYQLVLEDVMRRAPVLPARFGTRLPGREAAELVLRANEDRLLQAIEAYGHLLQFGIRVSGPRVTPGCGARVLAAREHIRLELKNFCLAMREEPAQTDRVLLCTTVLIRPWDEPRFDAAIARLDGEFGGWLRFTCIGPLPPCSFVRVTLAQNAASPAGWTLALASTLPGAAWPPVPLRHPAPAWLSRKAVPGEAA